MSFSEKVLVCDQVDAVLNNTLQKNGLSVTYEPQITPEELALKRMNLMDQAKQYEKWYVLTAGFYM